MCAEAVDGLTEYHSSSKKLSVDVSWFMACLIMLPISEIHNFE
jgi:hypothetical protein